MTIDNGIGTFVAGAGYPHETKIPDVETASDAYAQRFAGASGAWFLDVQSQCSGALVDAVLSGPLSVLEVGGGHGQLTEYFLAAGHSVVVHGSRPGCHDRLRYKGEQVQRVVSDLWRLPFPDASFDLVAGIRLLSHVEYWRELILEMARVTRRLVLVDFPVGGAVYRLAPILFRAKRRIERNTRPYFSYTLAEVENAFETADLRLAGVTRQFALPMVVHRVLHSAALSKRLEMVAGQLGLTSYMGSPILVVGDRAANEPGDRS